MLFLIGRRNRLVMTRYQPFFLEARKGSAGETEILISDTNLPLVPLETGLPVTR